MRDTPKMVRETLCVAQMAVGQLGDDRSKEHVDRLQRMIDAVDSHRPLGDDGKHNKRHTDTCGCKGHVGLWCILFTPWETE